MSLMFTLFQTLWRAFLKYFIRQCYICSFCMFTLSYHCSIHNDLYACFVWMDECQFHLFSICDVFLVTNSNIVTFITYCVLKSMVAWMDVRIICFRVMNDCLYHCCICNILQFILYADNSYSYHLCFFYFICILDMCEESWEWLSFCWWNYCW